MQHFAHDARSVILRDSTRGGGEYRDISLRSAEHQLAFPLRRRSVDWGCVIQSKVRSESRELAVLKRLVFPSGTC